jgi:hypothetical protein
VRDRRRRNRTPKKGEESPDRNKNVPGAIFYEKIRNNGIQVGDAAIVRYLYEPNELLEVVKLKQLQGVN